METKKSKQKKVSEKEIENKIHLARNLMDFINMLSSSDTISFVEMVTAIKNVCEIKIRNKEIMKETKLELLAIDNGFNDSVKMLTECCMRSTVPAICMNENCDATYEYEPDQDKGWCEECGTKSVQSCLIIAGLC